MIISFLRIGVKQVCQMFYVRIVKSPLIQLHCLKHRIKRPKSALSAAKASQGAKRVSFALMRADAKPTKLRKNLVKALSLGLKSLILHSPTALFCKCGFVALPLHMFNKLLVGLFENKDFNS
ncbi:hypothetical protein [Helicobacter labetoulli]|uniref:hypothetical protein n=2 Tax=Helicobacter labetoulli TaxID=2315333 RepID=UPI00130062C7|nr:hypothetical protein [Helicobacter labetoulli]